MRKQAPMAAGALVLLGFIFVVTGSSSDVPILWEAVAPMSLPRHSGTTVVVDGLTDAIGGSDETGASTDTVFIGEIVDGETSE